MPLNFLASTRANQDSLIIEPEWRIETMISNCSADVVCRLGGEYMRDNDFDQAVQHSKGEGVDSFILPKIKDHLKLYTYVRDQYTVAAAVPIWVAFSGVLSDCVNGVTYKKDNRLTRNTRLFIATDNVVGEGDVHLGPFSTRGFCRWLEENDLATISTTRAGRVQGWCFDFTGKYTNINAMLKDATAELIEYRKEANKVLKANDTKHSFDRPKYSFIWGDDL